MGSLFYIDRFLTFTVLFMNRRTIIIVYNSMYTQENSADIISILGISARWVMLNSTHLADLQSQYRWK